MRAAGIGLLLLGVALTACGETVRLSVRDGSGPTPMLPPPEHSLIPTVHVATAVGWPELVSPTPAPGFTVQAFARGLDHPRWLLVLRNGDVLVAETDAPQPRPKDSEGVKAKVMHAMMKKAGSGRPSADRITLLRDADGDGVAETQRVFLDHLRSPFGMTLSGGTLYVANTDALIKVPYHDGDTRIDAAPTQVTALPGGLRNHHWTKNVVVSPDGKRLYVSVGSNSNVGEYGVMEEEERAAVWEIDPATGAHRVFASGLRNPVGMAWQPDSGALWVAVNERDELGNDLVPDYMTALHDGAFYGWPYSYYGAHVDPRPQPPRPDLVARAVVPDYALGPHTASLGLTFYTGTLLPARYRGGAFVGQHGSWNRRPFSGYRVVFVPFVDGQPSGLPEDVLTGFVQGDVARGRPVGVAVARDGALLVADDVGGAIWRVVPAR
jgi:glucose/arabinose dehydrogenase